MPARMRGAAAAGLADDTRDLQRQMGCMAGIFQIFDRQRLITGAGRRAARQAQKRLPPPSTPPGNGSAHRRACAAPCISLPRYLRIHFFTDLVLVYNQKLDNKNIIDLASKSWIKKIVIDLANQI